MYENKTKEDLIEELKNVQSKLDNQNKINFKMNKAIEFAHQREKELYAIMKGAKAVLEEKSFPKSARAIFDHCKDLIGATSGYVALLSDTGEENEVLFLEAGGLPCTVNPELPMPIRGLRSEAYYSNKAVYHNDFMNSEWVEFMPKGHVILKNVMFAPLVLNEKTVGIIGLANKDSDFTDNDAKMASGFGELAAIALKNSYNLDERVNAEKQREEIIESLRDALAKVKKLSGLLPIHFVKRSVMMTVTGMKLKCSSINTQTLNLVIVSVKSARKSIIQIWIYTKMRLFNNYFPKG